MSSLSGLKKIESNSINLNGVDLQTTIDTNLVKTSQIATLPIGTDDNSKLFKGSDIIGYATLNFLADGELADINGIKTFISDTNQVKPSEGAFVNGDKTKLDNIEANANNYSLPSTVQLKVDTTGFVTGDKSKLDGIATGAEVNPDLSSFITSSSTNTLTNKSFDADATGNSITNIENANIKSNAAINISKTDLETLLRTKITSRMLVTENEQDAGLNYLGGNFIAGGDNDSGQSVQAYSQKFNADADHGLSHIQLTCGNNRSQSLIFSTGGNTANTTSGTNSHEANIQAYDTNAASARHLTIQKLGGSCSFGDPSQALQASIANDSTCTNFKIDCDNNTITNIDNNEIKSNAAIDCTKLADGSVDNTEFQKLGTIQTQQATYDSSDLISSGAVYTDLQLLVARLVSLEANPLILCAMKYDGDNDSVLYNKGFTDNVNYPEKIATGHYKFEMTSNARPSGTEYVVQLTVVEGTNVDDIIVQVVSGELTNSTFEIKVSEQDNGATAGVLIDKTIMITVIQ